MLCGKIDIFHSVAAVLDRFLQKRSKSLTQRRKIDPVLRTLRSRDSWLHVSKIQLKIDTVIDLAFARHSEHFLRTKIILKRHALLVTPTGRAQINNRFPVDWEESHGLAVLGRHVADRSAGGHWRER